jgi:hypothetical protein
LELAPVNDQGQESREDINRAHRLINNITPIRDFGSRRQAQITSFGE